MYSFTSSIQPYPNNREKIFAQILHFLHLTFAVSMYDVTQIHFKYLFLFYLYVVPQLFEQVYSIHRSIRGEKLPLLYSLLPNKKQATYEELFRIIEHKSKYATIDFEKGAETAFSVVFRQCDVFGCFFHFKQCIWRNICVRLFKSE